MVRSEVEAIKLAVLGVGREDAASVRAAGRCVWSEPLFITCRSGSEGCPYEFSVQEEQCVNRRHVPRGHDFQNVLVLGTDGNLWLEHPPWVRPGSIPHREQIDSNVAGFQGLDAQNVMVLGKDGNLWHAPFGNVPPKRDWIDRNVEDFQALTMLQILRRWQCCLSTRGLIRRKLIYNQIFKLPFALLSLDRP